MIDTNACPRCGQRNQCAQAEADAPVQDCWCFEVHVDRRVLDELPDELRDQACLCPRCAQGLPPDRTD